MDFVSSRETLPPVPSNPRLFRRELITRNSGIDTSTRITVPVPNSPESRASFDEADGEASFAEGPQLIDSREAATDYDDIELILGRTC